VKLRTLLALVVVLAGASLCARLGVWQLSRWREKQALNRAMRLAAAAPPIEAGLPLPPLAAVRGRYLEVRGRYDERQQIVLPGAVRADTPGVEVVTPLVLEDGAGAVLVNRGRLALEGAETLSLGPCAEPGVRAVIGYVEPMRAGAGGPPLAVSVSDSITLFWARTLDLDTLSLRLPYRLAPYALRQAPGPGVPASPERSRPLPLDEGMHLGYAVQWFSFGFILLAGSAALAWQRNRGGSRPRS